MRRFEAAIRIDATPDRIWSILTDAARYPEWNPTVTRIEGQIAPGERIALYVTASPGRAFPVTVTAFQPPRRMVWRGGMPLGLFTGTRTFTLTPEADGRVLFDMREIFSGLLAPVMARVIPDMQRAFETFAAALKRDAERER
jgi:hypothetical protein